MSTSRAPSQAPSPYTRKRSNTVQSSLRSPISATPLTVGNAKDLKLWVHEQANDVVFNPECWPGVAEDDMIRVTELDEEENDDTAAVRIDVDGRPWERHGFLFIVKKHGEDAARHAAALQISVPRSIADAFGLQNHSRVRLTKVDSSKMRADYIEIVFQDQYLGRSDMWRLGKQLQGQCVHVGQEIRFVGSPTGKIHNIYIDGKTVSAGLVTTLTRSIYRSLSAKVTIFIQVCRELWDFAGDGERYNEKVVHSFLPALFRRWRDAGTNHIVTIVLISRVYYEDSEVEYAAGPLRQDDDDRWYKDFFKVITDLEVVTDWKPTLVSLKESFVAFQRDILLTHHYHRAKLAATNTSEGSVNPGEVKLVGRISYAHEGPVLEALNLILNPMETHYVDRSLSLTGAATILITPGTGYYRVSKRLLRMTTTRLLDQGFGLDIVSLTKPPLHQTPIFSFKGYEPENRDSFRSGWRSNDPLWGGDDDEGPSKDRGSDIPSRPVREKTTFWWEPFWIAMSFWDQQMDLPFRQDRFVARAKIHQIEMLGLLEHDVLSSINVPYLPEGSDPTRPPPDEHPSDYRDACKLEAERFDDGRFKLRKNPPLHLGRESATSSGATIIMDSSSLRSLPFDKRSSYIMQRSSTITPRIAPIEESPRRFYTELPPEGTERDVNVSLLGNNNKENDGKLGVGALTPKLSSSPASSIASTKTEGSTLTSGKTDESHDQKERPSRPTMGLGSKLASSWIFNPFRSSSSSQNITPTPGATDVAPLAPNAAPASSIRMPVEAGSSRLTQVAPSGQTISTSSHARTPRPMNIRSTPTRRSILGQQADEEAVGSSRGTTLIRHSPRNTLGSSPRDDPMYLHRRSTITSLNIPMSASSPTVRVNPLRANATVPHTQSSLASRWQHMFPQPLYRHQIKWRSMVTPGCLPLTTEYFPTKSELESSYDVFSYEFIIDPPEMKSFLVRNPTTGKENVDEARRLWALEVMRGMASLRLVQGFQFIIRPKKTKDDYEKKDRSSRYFSLDDDRTPKPGGASEIFHSTSIDPVFLSMSNEIHRISYNGEAIQVRRYVRRMPPAQPFHYKCLVWPKLGVGYTELSTTFGQNGLENYVWNRLDMLIAGYEHQFSESLRYWRTRFIIIPTTDAPPPYTGASGEKLNDEEIRLLGSDKLAELLSKLRWIPPGEREKGVVHPPVRFLPTYLSPIASVMDEHLVSQLEEIMAAAGPQGKNMRSDRELADMGLPALAKLMREDKGLAIKDHRWHTKVYQDSFTGYDFTTWLWREFRDVSTREQAQEWGMRLMEKGLFEHCRGMHGFLDGHYFYRLTNDYTIPRTPNRRWTASFRPTTRYTSMDEKESSHGWPSSFYPGGGIRAKRNKKRLVLSQTMVIDVDPYKKSDQAEMVVLHTDLIHNPANVFHFELHWLGTTARCIEDQLRSWGARIERYGLRLVEAYVTQIADIRERNPFQSCFPMRLALPPPFVPELEKRLALATGATPQQAEAQAQYYFEYALLRKFGFILDIEANELYPDPVDVFYSYRRSAFTHSQFVHRTGVAFVQVLGAAEGFLFLTNRLMGHGKTSPSAKNRGISPAAQADALRDNMSVFCEDKKQLSRFYDEVLAALPTVAEEPPSLVI